jgi:hypothetical protein
LTHVRWVVLIALAELAAVLATFDESERHWALRRVAHLAVEEHARGRR